MTESNAHANANANANVIRLAQSACESELAELDAMLAGDVEEVPDADQYQNIPSSLLRMIESRAFETLACVDDERENAHRTIREVRAELSRRERGEE